MSGVGDHIRTALVTQFRCVKCNTLLKLSYAPEAEENEYNQDDYYMTGAEKVLNNIFIHPCHHCYEKAEKPSRLIREALRIAKE